MTKLNRLTRNEKVVAEINKALDNVRENEVITFTSDIDCSSEDNFIDVNVSIFSNGELVQEIVVATANEYSEELERKADKMKESLISLIERKTDIKYGI